MNRLIGVSIGIAACGLAMTVAGFKTEDPDNIFYGFRWFGPIMLALGAILVGLSIFLSRR